MRTLIPALFTLLFSLSAQAADVYRVEVVIVGFFDEASATSEQWPVTLDEPETEVASDSVDKDFLLT